MFEHLNNLGGQDHSLTHRIVMSLDPNAPRSPPNLRPCLISDIGNTLIRRERPGAKRRILAHLCSIRQDFAVEREQSYVAQIVLTARGPHEAAYSLAKAYGLTDAEAASVLSVALEPDGSAEVLPGARDLLLAGMDNGWRILLATNACAWVSDIPDAVAAL